MRLAVIGSRGFSDYNLMRIYLDKIHSIKPITYIVSGGAKGADSLSEKWAHINNVKTDIYIPDWNKFGKKAGYMRNNDIITNSDKVIAFYDGTSKGTQHSINLSKKLNKKIKIIYYDKQFIRCKKIKQILKNIEKGRFTLGI